MRGVATQSSHINKVSRADKYGPVIAHSYQLLDRNFFFSFQKIK